MDSDEDELDFLKKDVDETAKARDRERLRTDGKVASENKFGMD